MPLHSPCRHHVGYRFIRAIALFFAASLLLTCGCTPEPEGPAINLAPLPYAMDALAPLISARTLELHYGKHHAGYVTKANALIEKSRFKRKTVEEILSATRGKKKYEALFNNTAQAWNHAFFWSCLTPTRNGKPTGSGKPTGNAGPTGALAEAINKEFGGWKKFRTAFVEAAVTHFGSGWVWLVSDDTKLRIITTVNADTPIAQGLTPLFTIDLWEHAYYLDYQNRRKAYVEGIFDGLAHWKAIEAQYQP